MTDSSRHFLQPSSSSKRACSSFGFLLSKAKICNCSLIFHSIWTNFFFQTISKQFPDVWPNQNLRAKRAKRAKNVLRFTLWKNEIQAAWADSLLWCLWMDFRFLNVVGQLWMRRLGWSGFQGSLRSPWKARFARFARYNYKFSLGKEDFISDLNISQVGNFSLTANYTILTEEFCLNSFWVLMLIETLLILFFKCFVNPSTFQRQTFLENLTHSLGNCQIPSPIEDWDQTQGSIQSYKKSPKEGGTRDWLNFGSESADELDYVYPHDHPL